MISRTTYKAAGLVLRSLDYGESDRIVTFFTDGFGKVKAIAKGARRSRKRFANALEHFSLGRIVFSRRGREELALLEACDAVHHFSDIRTDLERTLTASYLIELIDAFTLEGKKNEELFTLLRAFLEILDAGNSTEGMVRIFELRLLRLLGYEPVLDRCAVCRTDPGEMKGIWFDPLEGGIRCGRCVQRGRELFPMMPGTVRILALGRTVEPEQLHQIIFSDASLRESRKALGAFIRHLLGKELKSLNVLNEIKRMAI